MEEIGFGDVYSLDIYFGIPLHVMDYDIGLSDLTIEHPHLRCCPRYSSANEDATMVISQRPMS